MIGEFIYKYYIDPIRYGHPYTIVDTLTYALILIAAVFFIYRWLQRSGISITEDLVLSTLPFVVLGGLLRVVEDTGIIQSDLRLLLVTPLIFFVIFFFSFSSLYISHALAKNGFIKHYLLLYRSVGIIASAISATVLCFYGIAFTRIGVSEFLFIILLACGITALMWGCIRYLFQWDFASYSLYKLLIFGHMLDASATSYGIDLHTLAYREVHVVGSLLIDLTGTAFSMFILKIIVIIPAIYLLEAYKKEGNKELWYIVVLCMITLGLAPGIRDMVRMVLYV